MTIKTIEFKKNEEVFVHRIIRKTSLGACKIPAGRTSVSTIDSVVVIDGCCGSELEDDDDEDEDEDEDEVAASRMILRLAASWIIESAGGFHTDLLSDALK